MKQLETPGMRPFYIGTAVVIVVVAVVAVLAATRGVTQFDESTPEGIAQSYVTAVLEGDHAAAHGFFSEALQDRCSLADLNDGWVPDRVRVTLRDVSIDGDTATVELRLTERAASSPFEPYEYSNRASLFMTASEDGWVIDEVPWPLYWCEPGR